MRSCARCAPRAGRSIVVETAAAGDARRLAETCDASALCRDRRRRRRRHDQRGGERACRGAATAAPALGIVPLGTANVLAHELGLGFSAAAIARTIIAGRAVLVQPGEAANGAGDPRCFSLMAGAGFDAKVVAGVSAPFKRRLGPRRLCLALAGRGAALPAGALWRRDRRRAPRGVVGDRDAQPPLCRALRRGARRRARRAAAACLPVRALGPLAHACASAWRCCWAACRAPPAIAWSPGRDVRVSVLSDAGEAARASRCRSTATTRSPCRCRSASRRRGAAAAAGLVFGTAASRRAHD